MSTRQLSSIRDSYLYSIFNHSGKMDGLLMKHLVTFADTLSIRW